MARSTGSLFSGLRNSFHCCDPSCISPTRSCKRSPYCEATSEERSAGNPHATFCGSRRWATTSGHPVGTGQLVSLPRSSTDNERDQGQARCLPRCRCDAVCLAVTGAPYLLEGNEGTSGMCDPLRSRVGTPACTPI